MYFYEQKIKLNFGFWILEMESFSFGKVVYAVKQLVNKLLWTPWIKEALEVSDKTLLIEKKNQKFHLLSC